MSTDPGVTGKRPPGALGRARTYTTQAGHVYPLYEAAYNMSFPIFKSDRSKAVIGDPHECIIAKGGNRLDYVEEMWIGGGQDAVVVFKPRGGNPAYALHFIMLAKAAKVRDTFELKGAPPTQTITLTAPTPGRTLDARAASNKALRARIKEGSHVPTPQSKRRKPHVERFGVAPRPRAPITKDGIDLRETVSA